MTEGIPEEADPVFVALKFGKQLRKKGGMNRMVSMAGSDEGASCEEGGGDDPRSYYGDPSSYYDDYGAAEQNTGSAGARPKLPYP